jgi:hypothetical protein
MIQALLSVPSWLFFPVISISQIQCSVQWVLPRLSKFLQVDRIWFKSVEDILETKYSTSFFRTIGCIRWILSFCFCSKMRGVNGVTDPTTYW